MSITNKKTLTIPNLEEIAKNREKEFPAWLNNIKRENLSHFLEAGLPHPKDEEWKYTKLTPLADRRYHFAAKTELKEKDAFARYSNPNDLNIVFINGFFSPELSNLKGGMPGISILTLKDAIAQGDFESERFLQFYKTKDNSSFAALNQALTDHASFIKVENDAVITDMIHIQHITSLSGKDILATPRSLIVLGKSSEITVMESHICFRDKLSYFTNALTDIFLEENATIHYCKAQAESSDAFHVGTTRVWQERSSTFDGSSFMTGAAIARNNLDIVLNGEGCNTTLNGLYSVNKKQHVDNHTSVDHRFPHCTSNQLYKGILNGAARAVFNGKIFVKPIAQQTNSYQLNKNLLLGKDCRVDTKPQLEIFADDVKCTHGATIGQLNEDELFYLQARCIPRKKAIILLSHGFVDDILNRIPNASIREKLNDLLAPTFAALE